MDRWTSEEVKSLEIFYPKYGVDFCKNLLGRSENSIKIKASKLKIKCALLNKDDRLYNKFLSEHPYKALEDYKGSQVKILHKHLLCGFEWKISPNNLQKCIGCPGCSKKGSVHNCKTYLYFIYIPSLDLYKIGITINLHTRLIKLGAKCELIEYEEFNSGDEAFIEEQKLKQKLKPYLFNTGKLVSGNTETFKWPVKPLLRKMD